jgi:hypothetical protein
MAVSRATRRAGFTNLVGALNPKTIVSKFKPLGLNFRYGTLWLDISVSPAVWYWFDGADWQA